MPRSAVIGCHTPAAPEPPRTPLLRLAFRGLDTPPAMKTAVCSGGCQRRLSPAAPQGPIHSLRVPGGASCSGTSGGSRSRTPAWPPSAAPFAGLPGAGLRRARLAPAGFHGCALTAPAACLRKPYPMRHGTPCRRRDRSRASQAPAHGSARRVSRTGTVAGGALRSGSWDGRRVVSHPHGARLIVGCRRAHRPFSRPQCGSRGGCHDGCHEQCCTLTLASRAAQAIPAPAPAFHTSLRADNHERPCGRPCRAVPPAGLVAAAQHPDRYGPRRSLAAVAVLSASAPAAASQAPCGPDAHAAFSVFPVRQPRRFASTCCHAPCHGLAEPPLLRSHTGTGTGCRTAFRADNHWRTCGSR